MKKIMFVILVLLMVLMPYQVWSQSALVFQSDFGLKDGAVASMKGVAYGVNPDLKLYDLTHEIPAFDIWAGAYQLKMTAPYWPAGTVFVSIVNPGGSDEQKSVVLKTKTGHYFISPDNGTLTLIAEDMGIDEVRELNESQYEHPESAGSLTFRTRHVYTYVGALLASGKIRFEDVGALLEPKVVMIPYQKPEIDGKSVRGMIPMLDMQFGNVWTNIDEVMFSELGAKQGDSLSVQILSDDQVVFEETMLLVKTYSDVPEGHLLAYFNNLKNLSFAINMENFAETYGIGYGSGWKVIVKK